MSKDYFNKDLAVGNTVVIVRDTNFPTDPNLYIVRICRLSSDKLYYKQYTYDGVSWFDIKERSIKCDRVFKYTV